MAFSEFDKLITLIYMDIFAQGIKDLLSKTNLIGIFLERNHESASTLSKT